MFSSVASAAASLADITLCWSVSLYILTASHASGTRTAAPTTATTSAVRHKRLDSDFALMRLENFAAGFEQALHLADQVERAGHADGAAGRRLRARDSERVPARRRERDCTRSRGHRHGAEEFFDRRRARVARLGQHEVLGGGEEGRADLGERLVAHRAEDHRHPAARDLVQILAQR